MGQKDDQIRSDGGPDAKRREDTPVDKKRFFRAGDRYFQVDGQWYFAAREGDQGPYRNRETAVVAAQRFIRAKLEEAKSGTSARKRSAGVPRGGQPLHRHALPLEQPVTDRFFLSVDD